MKKPQGFDELTIDFVPINLGGHHAGIMELTEQKSSTGKDMIVVKIDFAKEDSQPGYFAKQYREDTREDKKWPYLATQYILTEDSNGKCSRNFKAFLTAFLDSCGLETKGKEGEANFNKLFEAKDFCKQFQGRKIGVVYGEVEEEYNGEVKTRRRIRWFCSDKKVDDQTVPERKTLNTAPAATSTFETMASGIDDEIPFN